jgi:hypothetical protein
MVRSATTSLCSASVRGAVPVVLTLAVAATPALAAEPLAEPFAVPAAVQARASSQPQDEPTPAGSPWLSDQPSAAGSAAPAPAADMGALLKRLDALERRNESLEGEVSELRQKDSERTLTAERADEIRSIVRDVMSESSNYASLRGDVSTAGWNDGFFLRSSDGRFLLKFGALLQTRYIWSNIRDLPDNVQQVGNGDTQIDREGFDVGPWSSLWLNGHLFSPDVTYMVKGYWLNGNTTTINDQQAPPYYPLVGESAGPIQLADAWVRVALDDQWSVRVGQYRAPYSRETLIADSNQMAVDRSVIDYHLGLWYTQGIELESLTDDFRWRLSFDDGGTDNLAAGLQLVGTQPMNRPWYVTDSEWSVSSRFEYKLAGAWEQFAQFTSPQGEESGVLAGIGFHYSVSQPFDTTDADQSGENEWTGVTADISWMLGGASIFASGYWNYIHSDSAFQDGNFLGAATTFSIPDPSTIWGAVIQGSMYFTQKHEGFIRFEAGEAQFGDLSGAGGAANRTWGEEHTMTLLTTGLVWYLDGQDLKWTTDMGVNFTDLSPAWYDPVAGWRVSEDGEFVFRSSFQLMF